MNNAVLIDSFAHIYRGFYALPPLTNSSGMPTNAIFAFAKTLLFIEKNFPSSHGAAVFDKGRPLERLNLAPDYKATRPPTPPELLQQIPHTKEIADAFGWQVAEYDNCEADDIISAFCAKFAGMQIKIATNDKDLAQLVDKNITMLVTGKDGGMQRLDIDGVIAKFAVRPSQIVDYLSLIGDHSDNIPGAAGVGPKTASKLLAEFSSLENLLNNPSSIKSEKTRAAIIAATEQLKKNQKLIRLSNTNPYTDSHGLDEFAKREADLGRIEKICEELELKSILAEIRKKNEAPKTKEVEELKTYTPDLF
ncbi:MAG TPA: 5'-3' exonuclease H3TH domain-containing protein [Victivallales bacterium]|nr:5'-3' exonuclease H3TH domain-containing protein [Victivallales bacterium]